VSQQSRSTFVVTDPTEVVQALDGLKDVRVLHYARSWREVALVIEQVVVDPRCPSCSRLNRLGFHRGDTAPARGRFKVDSGESANAK
jgi:hypothetical protein